MKFRSSRRTFPRAPGGAAAFFRSFRGSPPQSRALLFHWEAGARWHAALRRLREKIHIAPEAARATGGHDRAISGSAVGPALEANRYGKE